MHKLKLSMLFLTLWAAIPVCAQQAETTVQNADTLSVRKLSTKCGRNAA